MAAQDPGWYQDPDGADRLRYWDGTHWTDAYAPQRRAAVPTPTAAPPRATPGADPTSVPFGATMTPATPIAAGAAAGQRKRLVQVVVVLAVLAVIIGALVITRVANRPTVLRTAYDICHGIDTEQTVTISDRDKTLVIDTHSEYGSIAGATCVFTALKTPQSVIAAVESTSALMGVRNANEDGLEYSWTYHPDNGLDMAIRVDGS